MNIAKQKSLCAEKIKSKLKLSLIPVIKINHRKFIRLKSDYDYKMALSDFEEIIEPLESWEPYMHRKNYHMIREIRDSYAQVYVDADKTKPFVPHVTEILVKFGKRIIISAAYNFMITGYLKTGEKFMTIASLSVRGLFRDCGLATLLKLDEISLAKQLKCDFIHTWHAADNPRLIAAMAPSLKRGFILYHGPDNGVDEYEDEGCIHLRLYLNGNRHLSKVAISGKGKSFLSPSENTLIIKTLSKGRRQIFKIITD